MGIFTLTQEIFFYCEGELLLEQPAQRVWRCCKPQSWGAALAVLGEVLTPWPPAASALPHLLRQGCSYMRLFHNFPTFNNPTCPWLYRLSVCSRLCLAELELHLTPILGLLLKQLQIFKGDERTWFKRALGCYIFITELIIAIRMMEAQSLRNRKCETTCFEMQRTVAALH